MKFKKSNCPNLKPVPKKNPFEDLDDKVLFALLGALIDHENDIETMTEERADNRFIKRVGRLVDLE